MYSVDEEILRASNILSYAMELMVRVGGVQRGSLSVELETLVKYELERTTVLDAHSTQQRGNLVGVEVKNQE